MASPRVTWKQLTEAATVSSYLVCERLYQSRFGIVSLFVIFQYRSDIMLTCPPQRTRRTLEQLERLVKTATFRARAHHTFAATQSGGGVIGFHITGVPVWCKSLVGFPKGPEGLGQ